MPTRIFLRDSEASSTGRRQAAIRLQTVDDFSTRPTLTPPSRIGSSPIARPSVQRSISVNFRTALRDSDHDESETFRDRVGNQADIRGSPRLMGYLSCGLASSVNLVSVMQFYSYDDKGGMITVFRRQLNETDGQPTDDQEVVFRTTILKPKLNGAVGVASAGVFFSLIILWMHMDTVVCPQLWREVFKDGSVHERNILILSIAFWIFGLYVCTSSFSIGEVQANVYFTTWICFFSIVNTYHEWRVSAGKKTLQDLLVNERETMRNWIGTAFCTFVAGLSVSDLYAFRNNLKFKIDGEEVKVPLEQWIRVLALVWSCAGACIGCIVMIHFWRKPKYPCGPSRCRFDGRFIECAVLLVMIAVWFWGILEYTEVKGAINGPSNAYFSIW